MAVNTASKRASVLTFGLPVCFVLPIPNGTVLQGDKQHLSGLYSGILVTPIVNTTRFSMLNFSQMEDLLPAPDGSFVSGDRLSLLGFYSGIPANLPIKATYKGYWSLGYWPVGYWPLGYWPTTAVGRDLHVVSTIERHLDVVATVERHLDVVSSVERNLDAVATID